MTLAIDVHGLNKHFGDRHVVQDVEIQVEAGHICGFLGPNGSGKTTTLRMLCGLLDPSEGQAWVAGHDVARDSQAVKDSIGYMAQRFGLYVDLTVDENMKFYADLFGIPEAERQRLLPELLRMTRMEPFRNRQAGKLSGGMKQKLGLMCTLLHRPEILFLDEPSNGVDPVSRRDFWAILYQLVKDGITVLVTTAYLDEAERCNRVGLMYKGRLIQCGAPDAARYQVAEDCYQVEAPDPRGARDVLLKSDGVLCVEPSGATLHLFLSAARTSPEELRRKLEQDGHAPAVFQRIIPSLEDIFIAQVRKAEKQ
jgi:ABC-2 type transport system ATP-binding protein